jgi:hypothetical protein
MGNIFAHTQYYLYEYLMRELMMLQFKVEGEIINMK